MGNFSSGVDPGKGSNKITWSPGSNERWTVRLSYLLFIWDSEISKLCRANFQTECKNQRVLLQR